MSQLINKAKFGEGKSNRNRLISKYRVKSKNARKKDTLDMIEEFVEMPGEEKESPTIKRHDKTMK